MKKLLTALTTLLILSLCLSMSAYAANYDSIAEWVAVDSDYNPIAINCAAIIGDSSDAYVVAYSQKINENNSYFLLTCDSEKEISLELIDCKTDDDRALGLFKVDSSYRATCMKLAKNSDTYTGSAYLRYFGDISVLDGPTEMPQVFRNKSVKVVGHDDDGFWIGIDSVSNDTEAGAALVDKNGNFLGFYWGDEGNGFDFSSAKMVVENFPQLESYYAATAAVDEPETTQAEQTTKKKEKETSKKADKTEKTTKKESDNDKDKDKKDDKNKTYILIGVIAGAAVLAVAAILIVKNKKNKAPDSSAPFDPQFGSIQLDGQVQGGVYPATDDFLSQPEATSPYATPSTEPEAPSPYAAPYPEPEAQQSNDADAYYGEETQSLGEPQHVEAPAAPIAPNGSGNQAQVEPIIGYAADVGETIPFNDAPQHTPPAAPDNSICIVGKGGRYNKQVIRQNDVIVIGRHPSRCTLVYSSEEKGISTVHCRLERKGKQILLTDLNSSYGTFVNGMRLTPNTSTELKIGDIFWLAKQENSFYVQP